MRKKCTMLMFMVIASFLFLASAAGKEILASIPQKDRPYLAQ
ncbi:hypothetical protein [Bacillus inaquosorum]|nr:hypothetical protein [Bacillus inaquosorum]MEC0679603.1 hypothetical protein [Bacillus inaquosorum]